MRLATWSDNPRLWNIPFTATGATGGVAPGYDGISIATSLTGRATGYTAGDDHLFDLGAQTPSTASVVVPAAGTAPGVPSQTLPAVAGAAIAAGRRRRADRSGV